MVVSVLTGARHRVAHVGRMPRTDASNLAQTLVSLAGQTGGSPTGGHTLETLTLGHTDDVDVLTLREDGADRDGLLEEAAGKVALLRDSATVDLDLHDVSLLLAEVDLADLGVADHTHHAAVLADASELSIDAAATAVEHLLLVLGEGLLLAVVPVLVEAALAVLAQMRGPHGGEGAQAVRGLDVANDAHSDQRRGLHDGDGLDQLTTVPQLALGLADLTQNVSHTGLVAHEGGQVRRLLLVVAREALHATAMTLSALARQETERTVTGLFELAMRHSYVLIPEE
mmetsp:Transcript_3519/g.10921  ORF Transcript_3519/g.10921 Transcript_3519/m.10921 type:complete len:285 (-) Transcript_3519:41-895(-)